MSALVLYLYSVVMWCAQPFLHFKLARRGRAEPGYLVHRQERFGYYQTQAVAIGAKDHSTVWVHAVSLGETRAAGVLIAALRIRYPSMRLLLTHGTATGRAEGKKLLRAGDFQTWQAWDTKAATERFLQHFQPCIGILIETELWPIMAATCAKHHVPLVIANARMSEKTFVQTKKFAWLAQPAYQSLKLVWPQSKDDAERFALLGAPVGDVLGNLKFDAQVDTVQLAQGKAWKLKVHRPIVMFASSREGEELQLLQHLQKVATNVQWLIVPRHPQRFAEVKNVIQQYGFKVSKRSDWVNEPDAPEANTVWLGDSLAEMALYYGMSDLALLGGSFASFGGQNLIEAAACGCPVVMGPSTFNFSQSSKQAVESGAAISVMSIPQAVAVVSTWLEPKNASSTGTDLSMARAATARFTHAHQGAAEKTVAALSRLLDQ